MNKSAEQIDRYYFEKRDQPGGAQELVRMCRDAVAHRRNDFGAWWRLSRALWWLGEQTEDTATKRDAGREGFEAGERAARMEPEKPEGHYWATTCAGEWSLGIGIPEAIIRGVERKFRAHLEAAGRADPQFDHGGIDRIWCRYYFKLPWPKRDLSRAIRHGEAAVASDPLNARSRYYLAEALWDHHRQNRAREQLGIALVLKPGEDFDPIDGRFIQEKCAILAREWHVRY
ncbi:MAG: hypothetical protein KDH09_01600 [Chrysiogenetes bacterium]|nr:hypothetical protein [Chrysiogenetes bacterium]